MRIRPLLRPKTALFYGILLLLVLTVCVLTILRSWQPQGASASSVISVGQTVILDAGHGGQDGGAAVDGVCEAPLNLAITRKTALLLRLLGQDVRLTRTDENALAFDPAAGVRANKNADLRARLEIWKQQPGNPFLSIHLNQFPQEKYHGAQIFYSCNAPSSEALAQALQDAMRSVLSPENSRTARPCKNVYLMEQITGTAVTIECGFLSNAGERALLQQSSYQTKIALAIAGGYLHFIAK